MSKYPGRIIKAAEPTVTSQSASGVWTLEEAAKYNQAGTWPEQPGPGDADFEHVTLLLHGDGTNGAQNNTFLDSSTNNFTITRNGNTTQGTFSPFSKVDGRWGNYFDGTGDFLSVSDNAAFTLGSGAFTFECWVYWVGSGQQRIAGQGNSLGANFSFALGTTSTDKAYAEVFVSSTSYAITSSANLSKNQWNHFAFVRDGATLRLYINGTQDGTNATISTSSVFDSSNQVVIGRPGEFDGSYWNGYISNFRLVKGTCLYPSGTAFTPSTAPLTAITNTSLLTCQSNRFKDNSTNNFTITRNGDVKVTPFSPFPTLTAYDAATNGGSAYFDGSGDSLSTASNSAFDFGTGSFTLECWFNKQGAGGSSDGVGNVLVYTGSGSNNATWLGITDSGTIIGKIAFNGSSWAAEISGGSVGNGSWNHVALVRNGSAVNLYLNGTSIANTTNSTNLSTFGTNSSIGVNYTSTRTFNGYIASARINKSAVYTTGFTPATSPFTAIANTSLLCNFTNAGIIDNSMSNNLETVGNAQIDTTTKKYGTGSMEFDGTGDWLVAPYDPSYAFGTGAFTIEFWIYANNISGIKGVWAYSAGGGAVQKFVLHLDAGVPKIHINGIDGISGAGIYLDGVSAISATTWTHIAFTRSGSTYYCFINGTQTNSGSNSTNLAFTTPLQYVGYGGEVYFAAFNGFIDDLRITRGKARYTSNFTPPAVPFQDLGA